MPQGVQDGGVLPLHQGHFPRLDIDGFHLGVGHIATGVSIKKTGPKEAMSGQPVRYVFSRIGNTSNVTLESFYWI